MPTTVTKKQKIEIGADLCAALQVISKKAPLAPPRAAHLRPNAEMDSQHAPGHRRANGR